MTDFTKTRVTASSTVPEPVKLQSQKSSKERVQDHTYKKSSQKTSNQKTSNQKTSEDTSFKGYVETLLLSTFETILNKSLVSHPEVTSRLKPFNNQIIRIKTVDPYTVIFLQIQDSRISLQTDTQEVVQARIRIPSSALAWCVLNPMRQKNPPWNMASGNADLLAVLEFWLSRWDFWQTVQDMLRQWMPEFQEFVQWFQNWYHQRRPEAEWFERLRTALLDWSLEQKKQRAILRDHQIALRSMALHTKQQSAVMRSVFWMLLFTNFILIFMYAGSQHWIEPKVMRQIFMAIAALICGLAFMQWRYGRTNDHDKSR